MTASVLVDPMVTPSQWHVTSPASYEPATQQRATDVIHHVDHVSHAVGRAALDGLAWRCLR
jgi:hypothetical protein